MSSLLRRQQRKIRRDKGTFENAPPQFRMLPDGGYVAFHPTKGARPFSARRLRAIARLAALRDALSRRAGR